MKFWFMWKRLAEICSTPGPKYCDRCGAANAADASVCSGCGMHFSY